jgi:hypothetical protein
LYFDAFIISNRNMPVTRKKPAAPAKQRSSSPSRKRTTTRKTKTTRSRRSSTSGSRMRGGYFFEDSPVLSDPYAAGISGGSYGETQQNFLDLDTTVLPGSDAQAGGSEFGQSLRDIAIPFGLVLAKTGLEAWRKKRSSKSASSSGKKKSSSSTRKTSTKTRRPASAPARTRSRRRSAVGGASDISDRFSSILDSIDSYVGSRSSS